MTDTMWLFSPFFRNEAKSILLGYGSFTKGRSICKINAMNSDTIIIRGARQHNLKNIDLDLPRNRFVVVTGLSGSGKSSLAFDTLYAEGQRRYVESLSAYARQFLERLDKPEVEFIDGLSPAIAIEQKTASHNPRSTVGTVTEIYDYLRLLFSRIGTQHCHQCGSPMSRQTVDQMVDAVMSLPEKTKFLILSPLVKGEKGDHKKLLKRLRKEGFARIVVDGTVTDLENVGRLSAGKAHTIQVVVDRLVVKPGIGNRLADSIELALAQSDGLVIVDVLGGAPLSFSENAACPRCGTSYPALSPAGFSFNSPRGACPKCDGMGSKTAMDPDRIIPSPQRTLREGAVSPWENRNSAQHFDFLHSLAAHYETDIDTPWNRLPLPCREAILYGSGKEEIGFSFSKNGRRFHARKTFEGVIPRLERRYITTDSGKVREEIRRYMTFRSCSECGGTRLNAAGRSVRVGEKNIAEVSAFSISEALVFFESMDLPVKKAAIGRRILKEIADRLGFLKNVGLGYLTLDRTAVTLSGGESQRIRLATQIGSKLTGVLYVLDEPSVGLHQKDNRRLLEALIRMRDLGNTVLVVEHDDETILSADHVVELGPGAGVNGGSVVFSGSPSALLKDNESLTGKYLSGRMSIPHPKHRRTGNGNKLTIHGAAANNLKGIDAEFPLGCFSCVSGVSGSGKSTLVLETLYNALAKRLNGSSAPCGAHERIAGLSQVDKVINIDQSPIGRTPRSNPGTYTGLFTFIRELFAKTVDAKMRGYKPGRFSFNVKGGRCEACAGDGIVKIEMHFLPDVYVSCDICRGKRYNRETLEIRYKGKNIDEVLALTVNQALKFFENIGHIRTKLATLAEVGLGYIRLGQPATTLSGGEAQRLKLARELSKRGTGKTVYILDEPTTGLHAADIEKLLSVLNQLVDAGNTVIVIEHNIDVIKTADHVIDLGPEGGDMGGKIVASGTPEEIAENGNSHTGAYLKNRLSPVAAEQTKPFQ